MSSSTWLAHDRIENSYVAIKILNGYTTDLVQRGLVWEHVALQRVSSPTSSPYCLQLLSSFRLSGKGSAGEHLCLVTQVFDGDVKSLFLAHSKDNKVFPLSLAKRILLHTLRGIAHAHSCGVVHTDLKHDNIFFDCRMSTHDFDELLASDPSRRHPPEASQDGIVQSAVSQPLPLPSLQEAMQRTFALGDFGSAQPIDKHTVDHITAVHLRPPEIIIGGPWNETVDIWTFGCLVFEIVTGRGLFKYEPYLKYRLNDTSNLLYQMICYTGEDFSEEQLRIGAQAAEFFDTTCNLRENPTLYNYSFEICIRSYKVIEEADVLSTARLMRRCLRLDPAERASAVELLSDPWFNGVD
ncbi:kinase-like protein [Laetiporus sulphureus 93-53]|uniref:Kinase-like protein n=1 Tax=Laetiporus sulphureus 93-53 TaxID=1314785 RepID=A0A165BGF4_9APHY|nr:kinase-like protein [Laetiporus sulphureus 93-53]KZT01010.1 kinase-like protein [Laetiporus sulphureus 93-53]